MFVDMGFLAGDEANVSSFHSIVTVVMRSIAFPLGQQLEGFTNSLSITAAEATPKKALAVLA